MKSYPSDRARELFVTYTRDLSPDDLQRLFTDDTRDAYRFFTRGKDDDRFAGMPLWKSIPLRLREFFIAFRERTVVGVVGSIRVRGLEQDSEPQVYVPTRQVGDNALLGYAPKDLVVSASVPVRAPDTGKPAGKGAKAKKRARVEVSASASKADKCR